MSNAQKAKTWFKSFRIAYTLTGAPPVIAWRTTAEEIFEGDPLTISSNEVSEAAADSDTLFGVAAAHGASGDVIPIWVGDRNNVFIGQADDDTGTLSALPTVCDIVEGSDGWKIDVGNNDEDVVRVLDYVPGDDTSDASEPGRYYFQIERSSWDGLVAAK